MEGKKIVAEKGIDWSTLVQEMPHQDISYPVFGWIYTGFEGRLRAGELHVWAPQGIFLFRDRRGINLTPEELQGHPIEEDGRSMKFFPEQSNKLVRILTDRYGWGEPPHFREILRDVVEIRSILPVGSKEEVEEIFEGLREKWKNLLLF